ncbi:MAG TPA: ABC transporter substrate-binding protein [Candidatus Binatia bacterium]|jgi:multiple sugar transport system substrate-binding protein
MPNELLRDQYGLNVKSFLRLIAILFLFFPVAVTAQETTLRFVTWKWEAPQVFDQAIADFEKQNPGVRVKLEIGPHSSTQFHDLLTQKLKNRDTELDVFFMDVIWPAEFASAGWALPLDHFFPVTEQDKFLKAPIEANHYRGPIFGVPVFIDAGVLYYRKDLLQKYALLPPRSWPELVQQAKMILAREKDPQLSGFSGQFKQYEGLVCNMMEYIVSNNGSLWDAKRLVSMVNQPAAREAVRFVRDKIIGEISDRGVLAYEEPESLALFTQGRAIFHRNWPYAWKIANDPEQSKIAGKVGMMPLPRFPGGTGASTLGGWQLGISRFSTKPDLAWRLVSFMTSKEIQKRIALFTGRGPTRLALYDDPEFSAKIPQIKSLLETFKQAVPRPITPVYVPLSNIMQRYFSSALALPDSNIDQRATLAARDMDRVLDLLREAVAP